jgi:hypothetical protein
LFQDGKYFIEDLKSQNGTLINGRPADQLTQLSDGDQVAICRVHFQFRRGVPTAADQIDVAVTYGASVTPHVFVLDGNRKIAYMGAVDDSMSAGEVKQPYLRDALDAVLAGKAPAVTETRQVGCGIQYEKR